MNFVKKVGWLTTLELIWTALASLFFLGATIYSMFTHAKMEIVAVNLIFFLALGVFHRLSVLEAKLKLNGVDWHFE